MHFIVKFAASTIGIVGASTSAYWLVDDKRRAGVVFAASVVQHVDESHSVPIQVDQQAASSPIRSSERWNWNWDGSVVLARLTVHSTMMMFVQASCGHDQDACCSSYLSCSTRTISHACEIRR
jgi:hypothetical protein